MHILSYSLLRNKENACVFAGAPTQVEGVFSVFFRSKAQPHQTKVLQSKSPNHFQQQCCVNFSTSVDNAQTFGQIAPEVSALVEGCTRLRAWVESHCRHRGSCIPFIKRISCGHPCHDMPRTSHRLPSYCDYLPDQRESTTMIRAAIAER